MHPIVIICELSVSAVVDFTISISRLLPEFEKTVCPKNVKMRQCNETSQAKRTTQEVSKTLPMALLMSILFAKAIILSSNTPQKMKFSIKEFFSKPEQIRRKLRIWSHLLRKSLMENFIFYAV